MAITRQQNRKANYADLIDLKKGSLSMQTFCSFLHLTYLENAQADDLHVTGSRQEIS